MAGLIRTGMRTARTSTVDELSTPLAAMLAKPAVESNP